MKIFHAVVPHALLSATACPPANPATPSLSSPSAFRSSCSSSSAPPRSPTSPGPPCRSTTPPAPPSPTPPSLAPTPPASPHSFAAQAEAPKLRSPLPRTSLRSATASPTALQALSQAAAPTLPSPPAPRPASSRSPFKVNTASRRHPVHPLPRPARHLHRPRPGHHGSRAVTRTAALHPSERGAAAIEFAISVPRPRHARLRLHRRLHGLLHL